MEPFPSIGGVKQNLKRIAEDMKKLGLHELAKVMELAVEDLNTNQDRASAEIQKLMQATAAR